MRTHTSPERLAGESAQGLVTSHLCEGYSFNPGITETILKRRLWVRTWPERETSADGPVIGCFPSGTEQAGKPLRGCEYIAVRLTLYAPGDDECVAGPGHLPAAETR